jgi:hypothetical protein
MGFNNDIKKPTATETRFLSRRKQEGENKKGGKKK